MAKLTAQKLHKIIQEKIQVKSSKYSVSQKINRRTYDVVTLFKKFYGVAVSSNVDIQDIIDALTEAGIKFDDSEKERGFVKVWKFQ